MLRWTSRGSYDRTQSWLRRLTSIDIAKLLEAHGAAGVAALASATPHDSGLAANSWSYQVEASSTACRITWLNHDIETGFPVAIMLQYGYATGTGGYVQGRDYINPAIRPVFDQIEADIWKAVTS